jgi:1,4-alpha-glucan branching enzyme
MSIKKVYLNSQPLAKVTFHMSRKTVNDAEFVYLVGDFNNWDEHATPMRKMPNGDFQITLELEAGKVYQYRYLLNGNIWENDWYADEYVPTPYGDCENSVVIL